MMDDMPLLLKLALLGLCLVNGAYQLVTWKDRRRLLESQLRKAEIDLRKARGSQRGPGEH